MPENDDVLKVYDLIQGQVITAGPNGTIVDLDYNALFKVMELYEIQDKLFVLNGVRQLFHAVLEIKQEQGDNFQAEREDQ